MKSLIDKIVKTSRELEVKAGAIDIFVPLLEALGNKDMYTLEHSARVAYLGADISEFTHLVPKKTLWVPGLLHDIGKLAVNQEILKKTSGFNEEDMEHMKKHVEYGCRILLGTADFSAYALFFHHFFKKNSGYPKEEDFKKIFGNYFDKWTEGTKILGKYCGRLISVSDFYDAITTRENEKFSPGKPRLLTREEAKGIMVQENQDQEYLINRLYDAGIFGGK
ncbi:MAG: HD domain-containing protein [Candidatus Nanoarchaeia archaeon]|nr:HD domain-containing protein [Candidatus Nanoarchaeia archaeon]MDD5741589.1 HD domain-containing protein [Candidatus Nanoarchaeia archaeon]